MKTTTEPVGDGGFQRLVNGMRPIIFAFRLSGIPLFSFKPGEKPKFGVRVRWLAHAAFVSLLAFFVIGSGIAINIYHILSSSNKGDIAQRICGIVIMTGVASMHFILLLKYKMLNELLSQLFRQSVAVPHLGRLVHVTIVTSYGLSILICVNYVNFGKDFQGNDEQLLKSINETWAKDFDPFVSEIFEIIVPVFTGILILPFYFLTIGVFIIVCAVIEQNFAKLTLNFSDGIDDSSNFWRFNSVTVYGPLMTVTPKLSWASLNAEINKFFKRHQTICHLVELADDVFGIMCFVWCSAEVIAIVLAIRSMDLTHPQQIRYQLLAFVVSSVICFVSRSIFAANVNSKVLNSLRCLRLIPEEFLNTNSINAVSVQSNINSYVLNTSVTAPSITGWGFFSVNKGLILTVGSTIVTYVLVLYQDT